MEKNLVIAGIVIIVIVLVLMFSRARQILATWAREKGYEILPSDLRFLSRGCYKRMPLENNRCLIWQSEPTTALYEPAMSGWKFLLGFLCE